MSQWTQSELYSLAKAGLTPGERIALRYVEIGIELDPGGRDQHRRETADGWILDESAQGLTVVYRQTGPHSGVFGFVFRRG